MFRIPGTQIRFGLDFLIGWIPGRGDAAAGIASLVIIVAAWRRGAALVTLARMGTNVVLEAALRYSHSGRRISRRMEGQIEEIIVY